MSDLSTTAASNSPAGGENPISTDDFHRAIQSILRHTNAKGADIASATTTNIGAATGEFVDVTGTVTITGLGTIAAGIVRTVRFTGALTLTHNGTSLILPSGANITTAANDVAMFRSLGSGNWLCIGYKRQDGTAIVGFSGGTVANATTFSSTVAVNGDMTLSGATLKQVKGADVASATALPLITDGNYFDVTGTTTITSMNTMGVGTQIVLHFDGALTLTHHATDLILPSGANITTAAGDEAGFIEYATGDWRCIYYTKASGMPVVASDSFTLLGTITTTSGASQGLTSLDLTPYVQVVCHVNNVSISAIATMNLNAIAITPSLGGAGNNFSGIITLMLNNSQGITHIAAYTPSLTVIGATSVLHNSGISTASTAITFTTSSGTFDNGSITVYGVK
jgi:hypothetical protein